MNESLNNLATIRQYLLGNISDETMLEGIEELLFTDDDFCQKAEIIEDDLINDFVFGKLLGKDLTDFEKTLENNSDRWAKVQVTQTLKAKLAEKPAEEKVSFFDSIRAFFSQPVYAGAFAVLLLAFFIGGIFWLRPSQPNELAQLEKIYEKERPVEPRIADFDYAPLIVTRGADNQTDEQKRRLRLLETKLLEAVEANQTATNHHALGVFYLTQTKYAEAIKELETAVKSDERNAKFHNDLGTALFEFGKTKKDKDIVTVGRASEEFSKALELSPNSLEALFNKALALQELNLPKQATEFWQQYLQKDSTSKWADEARKNLEKIEQNQSSLNKKKEEVLNDFLTAYRNGDEKTVWKIHNSTKGMFTSTALAEQLSHRFLEARKNKDDTVTRESIEALTYIGKLEKEKHADFFFAELADFYKQVDDAKIDKLLRAKELLNEGVKLFPQSKFIEAVAKFEEGKKIFEQNGNKIEASLAEVLIGEALPDAGRLEEGIRRLENIVKIAEKNSFQILLPTIHYWLAVIHYRKNQLSRSIKSLNTALSVAEEKENLSEIQHISEFLATIYGDLGELEKKLFYLGKAINNENLYYINLNQTWRNVSTISDLMIKVGYYSTAIDFAKESVNLSNNILGKTEAINYSLNKLAISLIENKYFDEALKTTNKSREIVLEKEQNEQNINTIAKTLLWSGNIKRQIGQCEDALNDYDKSLEFYANMPQTTYNIYEIHQGKLNCFQTLQRQADFEKELETVLNLAEENRQSIKEDSLRQSFFDSQQFVYDAAILNSLGKNDKEKAFEFAEISKARSLLEFIKSDKSIAEVEKDFGNVAKPLTLAEIQSKIPENVQIVEYAWLNDRLAMWTITKNHFELTEKPIDAKAFEQKIGEYRKAIIENKDAEAVKKTAKELYEILLPKDLEAGKILCLIPDKSLHQIPFASLISPNGKYLIEDFAVLYSPSSSVLVAATENAKGKQNSTENLLAIGNPRFEPAENPNLKDLPEAETEAKEIAKVYQKSDKYIGGEATKNSFLSGLESAEVIHFAGHYVANPESPTNSRFVLADEYLLSFELSDKKLPNSRLAVLSACETGFEKFNQSEGAIGIARTFLAMGTPLVAASSWKVDSAATKNLMISFHQKRRLGKLSSVEALRQAQLEMLKTQEFSAPKFWSAFSLTGGLTSY